MLAHVDTDKSELLINNRFPYVSVSRAQYDAQISRVENHILLMLD